jgi:hypothetical protein
VRVVVPAPPVRAHGREAYRIAAGNSCPDIVANTDGSAGERGLPSACTRHPRGTPMQVFKELLSTDVGLLSLGAILFMVVMAIYLFVHVRKLMNQQPGKEGWD